MLYIPTYLCGDSPLSTGEYKLIYIARSLIEL